MYPTDQPVDLNSTVGPVRQCGFHLIWPEPGGFRHLVNVAFALFVLEPSLRDGPHFRPVNQSCSPFPWHRFDKSDSGVIFEA
jgi:hypothetical protein